MVRVLGLDAANRANKAKISGLLKTSNKTAMLVVVEGLDAKREKRDFIEVGIAVDD